MPYNVRPADRAVVPSVMGAVVQRRFGGVEQLTLRTDVAVPQPGSGEVLVRTCAAALDHGTVLMMQGRPWLARPVFGLRHPKHAVPGLDVSGHVVALGADVTGIELGDAVVGISRGSLAEYAVVPVTKLAPAPSSIDLVDAAALPVSGITALQALQTLRGVELSPTTSVLVLGASGGVGHYVVQLAAATGAPVSAVCSAAKADFTRSLGAADVIPYDGGTDVFGSGRTWDVVVDIMGNTPLTRLRRITATSGRILLVGGDDGSRFTAGYGRQMRALVAGPFLRRKITVVASRERADDLAELVRRVDAGEVRPHVDRRFPLAEVADALGHLTSGAVRGKVVVSTTS